MGHVIPADPHHPEVGNLQMNANSKTFGKQATRQHDRHRKYVRYRLSACGEMVRSIASSALLCSQVPQAGRLAEPTTTTVVPDYMLDA